MLWRGRIDWRSLRRRLTALVALLAYVNAAIASPLPPLKKKNTDQPFPCQDRACGCNSAEDFWRGCCCYSPAERLAWAEANGITPPEYAEQPPAPTEESQPAASEAEVSETESCCCGECCASSSGESKQGTCCSSEPSKQAPPGQVQIKKRVLPSKNGLSGLPAISALHCKSGVTSWVWTAEVLPVNPESSFDRSNPPGDWVVNAVARALSRFEPPQIPPPRSPFRSI